MEQFQQCPKIKKVVMFKGEVSSLMSFCSSTYQYIGNCSSALHRYIVNKMIKQY